LTHTKPRRHKVTCLQRVSARLSKDKAAAEKAGHSFSLAKKVYHWAFCVGNNAYLILPDNILSQYQRVPQLKNMAFIML
jgi:hypothetical protein